MSVSRAFSQDLVALNCSTYNPYTYVVYRTYQPYSQHINHISHYEKGDREAKLQMEMELEMEMDGLLEIGYALLVNGFLFNHKSQRICQSRSQGMQGGWE